MSINKNKALGLATASLLTLGVGCDGCNEANKYSKNTDCGEFGEFLLDDGFERREYFFEIDELPKWEDTRPVKVVEDTRNLVRACELGVKMDDKSLGESARYFSEIVMNEGEPERVERVDELVKERTNWAVYRGLVETCSDLALQVDFKKYEGETEDPSKLKEDMVMMLERSCTAIYYRSKEYAQRD